MLAAEEFVENLMREGPLVACDESNEEFFCDNDGVPKFYNEEKFENAKKFYHYWIYGMFYSKLIGLMAILAVPSIARVLEFTNMSSEPRTAYKRYLATIFHMNIWYTDSFVPHSKLWRSLREVKSKHNTASKRSSVKGRARITQYDMALTQFGFMGFVISKPKLCGIYGATNKELDDFIHFWRVIGHLMGIEERFNICNGSVEETREICNLLLDKILSENANKESPAFLKLTHSLVSGMWCMQPFLEPNVFTALLYKMLNNDYKTNPSYIAMYSKLTAVQRLLYWFIKTAIGTYRFTVFRLYHNITLKLSLWLMKTFPFLAFYEFGRKESYVKILNEPYRINKSG